MSEIEDLGVRVRELEKAKAVDELKIGNLEEEVSDLKKGINRALWAIGGSFITTAVAALITGVIKWITGNPT